MDNQEIEIELRDDTIDIEVENSEVVVRQEENVIESISVNGVEQQVVDKNVDISVPTKISDLDNDSNFVEDEDYVHTDNNYSDEDNAKLDSLENYDDTEIKADITNLQTDKANKNETYTKTETDTLLNGKANTNDIPTTLAELTDDSTHRVVTDTEKTTWNNKSDFSGSYEDLSNKPDLSGFITKSVNDLTYYTLKTSTGSLIDLEINGTTYVVTLSLKDIDGNVISTDTIDLPLESVVVGGSFDSVNKKIVLTLENGNTVDIPVGDLISGLQTEITSQNKLASDLVDDTNSGNKFVTTSEKQTWNGKYDKPSGGIPSTDLAEEYVKPTDYATSSKGGAIKSYQYNNFEVYNGLPFASSLTYQYYLSRSGNGFVGKDTLENVINNSIILQGTTAPTTSTVGYRIGQLYLNTTDNKVYQLTAIDNNTYNWQQLIRDIDYATSSKGGVVKTAGWASTTMSSGVLVATTRDYTTYQGSTNGIFVSKGTLENVITGKELVNKTYVDDIVGDIESILEELDIGGGVQ